MSDSQPISTMSTFTAKNWTAGEVIDESDLDTEFDTIDTLIDQIKVALADIQNCRATSNHTPTDNAIAGQIAFDTTLDQWFGDPDAGGADDEFLTRLKAYIVDCVTAGTATFRVGGPLSSGTITADSARTTTGDFTAFTLPAGTLARDGQSVEVWFYGTRTGAVGTFSLQPIFGTTNLGTAFASTINSLTAWVLILRIVRTGATTQDYSWFVVPNSDATGSVTLAAVGTAAETLSGALAIKLNLAAIGAGTVTQSGFIVEFKNY